MKNFIRVLTLLILAVTMYADANAQAWPYTDLVYDEPYQWSRNSTTDPASRISVETGGCCGFQTGTIHASANTTSLAYAYRAISARTDGMLHEFTVTDARIPSLLGLRPPTCTNDFENCMPAYLFDDTTTGGTRQIGCKIVSENSTSTWLAINIQTGDKLAFTWTSDNWFYAYKDRFLICGEPLQNSLATATGFSVAAVFKPSSFTQTASQMKEWFYWPY